MMVNRKRPRASLAIGDEDPQSDSGSKSDKDESGDDRRAHQRSFD
jgi:hypothetical protein